MGILANTVNICQFRVTGALPAGDLAEWAGECLARKGFRPIDQGAEELSVGWAHIDDPQRSDFADSGVFSRDHYLAFTLRRDQRRIPAALFKTYFNQAQSEFLAATPGLQRVPKQKKEELRDAVRLSLFARTLPAPSFYDAVWDTRTGLVSFTSLSPQVVELFENQFKQSFEGLRLVTVHPYDRAEAVLDEALKPALAKANGAGSETVLDLIQGNRWLGRDFLHWLLYQSLNGASEYRVSRPGPALEDEGFVAYLDDRLTLVGDAESGQQKVTVAGPQDRFSEVRTALHRGKEILEARLHIEKREQEWTLTLKGELFQFSSFKAPAVQLERDEMTDPGREREAVFYERMYLLEEGMQLFDSLFAAFLRERLGGTWPEQEKLMGEWLAEEEA